MNKDYDICFLSILYPGNIPEYDVLTMHHRAQNITAIQKSILEGIEEASNSKAWVINTLLVPLYGKGYKSPVVKEHPLSWDGIEGVNYRFWNVRGIYASGLFHGAKEHIKQWANAFSERQKIMVAYSLTSYTVKAMQYAKAINPSIRTLIIAPDLPQYTYGFTSNPLIKLKNQLSKKRVLKDIKRYAPFVDGWILFSEHMTEEIPNCTKHMVMESVFSDLFAETVPERIFGQDTFDMIYAGGCNKEYGLPMLLKAFSLIPMENIRLAIFGKGNWTAQIEEYAKKDKRVVYMGEIPRNKLLAFQKGADLLINPRVKAGIFTKYSFPSKNMEYLSSGTPMIGFKLEGIPDIYDSYINYFAEESAESLAFAIMNIYNNYEAAMKKAAEAQLFVSQEKNKCSWGHKIIQFAENL